MANHFDFLNSINTSKKNVMEDEKDYSSFMVNRGLSYFHDTAILANEMNQCAHIDGIMQYEFLLKTIRKKKRFSKWFKAKEGEDLQVVKEYFKYSNQDAKYALSILKPEQIQEMKQILDKGGKRK